MPSLSGNPTRVTAFSTQQEVISNNRLLRFITRSKKNFSYFKKKQYFCSGIPKRSSAVLFNAGAVRTLKVWNICAYRGRKSKKKQNKFGYFKSFLYLCGELSTDSSVATLQRHIYY